VSAVFGTTGWIDGGVLGPLPAKRHPSGGSRHPLEAYPVVWNAAGVVPGLYHVDARGRRLELLRRGDFRLEAAAFGSGQSWIARAGFVVVLTAVFARTLWKYPSPNAYRLLLLEAGHAAQNFALLCAALGLGPFQTAALQEGRIEAFLGLDGFREFPVYLLGAGTPARPGRATSRTSPPPG
jgi:SagB-type dehydrogenase family enzyme